MTALIPKGHRYPNPHYGGEDDARFVPLGQFGEYDLYAIRQSSGIVEMGARFNEYDSNYLSCPIDSIDSVSDPRRIELKRALWRYLSIPPGHRYPSCEYTYLTEHDTFYLLGQMNEYDLSAILMGGHDRPSFHARYGAAERARQCALPSDMDTEISWLIGGDALLEARRRFYEDSIRQIAPPFVPPGSSG
jgi:hypothetical protein